MATLNNQATKNEKISSSLFLIITIERFLFSLIAEWFSSLNVSAILSVHSLRIDAWIYLTWDSIYEREIFSRTQKFPFDEENEENFQSRKIFEEKFAHFAERLLKLTIGCHGEKIYRKKYLKMFQKLIKLRKKWRKLKKIWQI